MQTAELNNSLLNGQWVIDEIKRKLKGFCKSMKMKTQHIGTYETQQSQSSEESL
jgi:hypothetical protein